MGVINPWRVSGSARIAYAASEPALLERVGRALDHERKSWRYCDDGSISFGDSGLLSPRWLTLVAFDGGRIWIDRAGGGSRLRYELRSLTVFLFYSAAACLFGCFVAISGGPWLGLQIALGAFACIHGMNMLVAALRVPVFFGKLARG